MLQIRVLPDEMRLNWSFVVENFFVVTLPDWGGYQPNKSWGTSSALYN